MNLMYFFLGWFFFATGAVGTVLPVLPTTPFMLLALWCFSKSSKRFHNWLYQHPFFGPALQQWSENRVIPFSAKLMSVTMMTASFIYLAFFRELALVFLLPVASIMLYGIWFILSKPSRPDA
ncbi:MAG: YbaN family protein [Gammaproteobacteria bacterium]|nr:YbaN family protein [Gammaproteobacteria bacterium]